MSLTFPEEAGSTRCSRKATSSIHPALQPDLRCPHCAAAPRPSVLHLLLQAGSPTSMQT